MRLDYHAFLPVNRPAMGTIPDSPLGKATHYPESYDAGLLYSVDRAPQRQALGIGRSLPFTGVDRWTA